jgi:hypothetical protein
MNKELKTEKETKMKNKQPKTFTTKQVSLALLPWAIIVLSTVFFLGNVNGWQMRGNQQDQITAAADHMLTSLKPKQ